MRRARRPSSRSSTPTMVTWQEVQEATSRAAALKVGLRSLLVPRDGEASCSAPNGLSEDLARHAKALVRATATGLVSTELAKKARQVRPACPLGTLGPLVVSLGTPGLPSPYPYTWGRVDGTDVVDRVLSRDHSDGHIHISAILPFEVQFFLAISAVAPTGLTPMTTDVVDVGGDVLGRDLQNTWFLTALALALVTDPTLSAAPDLGAALEEMGAVPELDDPSELWSRPLSHLRSRYETHEGLIERFRAQSADRVSEALAAGSGPSTRTAQGLYRSVCALKERAARTAQRGGWPRSLWLAFVAREHAMFQASQVRGRGLEMFSAAFGVSRRQQGATSRRDLVNLGLASLRESSDKLAHVEVRPAMWMGGPKWGAAGVDGRLRFLAEDYLEILTGYSDVLAATGMTASFPRSLLKRRSAPDGEIGFDSYEGAFRAAEAQRDLLEQVPGLAEFAPGLDVAGVEHLVPNLVYSAVFDLFVRDLRRAEIDERLIVLRFHAGEWFANEIDGLRRVSEAIRACRTGQPRLGHCLALGAAPNGAPHGPWDRLDDGLWLWGVCEGRPDLQAGLAAEITPLIQALLGDDLSMEQWEGVYRDLTELDTWIDLGLVVPNRAGSHTYTGVPHPHQVDAPGMRYLTRWGSEVEVAAKLVSSVSDACRAIAPLAKAHVIADLRASKAIIECCPTSNMVVGGLVNEDHHPLPGLVTLSLPVSLSTDDPGLLHTTIVNEYESALWTLLVSGFDSDAAEGHLETMRRDGDRAVRRPNVTGEYQSRLDGCIDRLRNLVGSP